eukprot:Opistho-2@37374
MSSLSLLDATVGDTDAIRELLRDPNIDIDRPNSYGHTPLMNAAFNGFDDIVKLLIDKGADLNVRDIHDETPLMVAAKNGHIVVVKRLVGAGAELTLRDRLGYTAHDLARNHPDVEEYLFGLKANIVERTARGIYNLGASVYNLVVGPPVPEDTRTGPHPPRHYSRTSRWQSVPNVSAADRTMRTSDVTAASAPNIGDAARRQEEKTPYAQTHAQPQTQTQAPTQPPATHILHRDGSQGAMPASTSVTSHTDSDGISFESPFGRPRVRSVADLDLSNMGGMLGAES